MEERTCPCGHARTHKMVSLEPEYTFWGWTLLTMFGATPNPIRAVYRCQGCKVTLGATRDPELLKQF